MKYKEYLKLKKDIELEYKKNIEALEIVWKRYKNLSGDGAAAAAAVIHADKLSSENLSNAVRIVVRGMSQDFTVDDIEQGLIDHGFREAAKIKRISLTNILHRFARRGELSIIKKGQGRLPGLYRKKNGIV